ncbi:MAG: hypothetical protein HGA36_04435 [Candidatus Moranbacteria bacterium]|nr:hypothetical protein [Candidatus Moranbacteria bacterium]
MKIATKLKKRQEIVFLTLLTLLSVAFLATKIAKADTPLITAFVIPASSSSLTVPITTFTATDGILVTGFYVSQDSFAPALDDGAWIPEAPMAFTFATEGSKTLYAWVKDALGNISASATDSVVITLTVSDLTPPSSASNLSVQ